MSARFKMNFNHLTNNRIISHYNSNSHLGASKNISKSVSLNSPMIDRVYKARPGCSACGKKVA